MVLPLPVALVGALELAVVLPAVDLDGDLFRLEGDVDAVPPAGYRSLKLALGVRVLGVNPGPVESDRLVYLAKLRAKKRLGDESRWQEILKNMPLGRPARRRACRA